MRWINDKDMRSMCAELLRDGWTETNSKKHLKLKSPCGRATINVSVSPSDTNASRNLKRDIERKKKRLAAMGPKP